MPPIGPQPHKWSKVRQEISEMLLNQEIQFPKNKEATAHCAAQRVEEYFAYTRQFSTHRNGKAYVIKRIK